jgi:hypothetical protein
VHDPPHAAHGGVCGGAPHLPRQQAWRPTCVHAFPPPPPYHTQPCQTWLTCQGIDGQVQRLQRRHPRPGGRQRPPQPVAPQAQLPQLGQAAIRGRQGACSRECSTHNAISQPCRLGVVATILLARALKAGAYAGCWLLHSVHSGGGEVQAGLCRGDHKPQSGQT